MRRIVLALFMLLVIFGIGVSVALANQIYLPITYNPPTPTPTPPFEILLPNGDFEQGPGTWTEVSNNGRELILEKYPYGLPFSYLPYDGSWAAWLGFANNEIDWVEQKVLVPTDHPYLSYWNWIASEDTTCDFGHDVAEVNIGYGSLYYTYFVCRAKDTNGWVQKVFDLRAYAGQSVDIKIGLVTDSLFISNLFIDHIAFQSSP